jgi:hypothetical protein
MADDRSVRVTHHERSYEFGVGALEKQGDRYLVRLRHGDDTEGHFLVREEMGRVVTVSGGSGPEVRVRLEKDRRRYQIWAALRGDDDVSGHARQEETLSGEVTAEEPVVPEMENPRGADVILAAAAAWIMSSEQRPAGDVEAGELPTIT